MSHGCETPARASASLLSATTEPGVYVRSERFQIAVDALQRGFFTLRGLDAALSFRSPGVAPRAVLERSSYIERFPQLVSRVAPELSREDPAAGEGLVTLPSACLSLYPLIAGYGPIPAGGLTATIAAPCFRNEAHYGPERMRAFHMAEYVFFGDPRQAECFRVEMMAEVEDWLLDLQLTGRFAGANDPFFGRLGEILAERQRTAGLKTELLIPYDPPGEIAGFSFNDHRDFFCQRWDIHRADGGPCVSSCVGVGLERLALALFQRHGESLTAWPRAFKVLL